LNTEQIISILSEVRDPEIPVLSISELGILRSVEMTDNKVSICITPTYSGCPAMETIQEDIHSELAKHGITQVEITQSLSPAWTTEWMTDSGKKKLLEFGIAPPTPHGCSQNGNDHPAYCPHCHSRNLELISRFGSTACKALYRCLDCQEPFDYFKCH
jgi:ring-1,2-phenylacetyl-CoA epoxidase subunit PaaD